MSSLFERHPDRDLVRYLDGELSPRRAEKISSHLESCGRCRAELEEFKSSLAEGAVYQDALASGMPPAPQPWRDLYRDFSRIDESLANTSLLGRLMRPLVHSGAPRWAFIAGLAVLMVLSLNQLRRAPSVHAESILRKAVQISESQPRPTHRLRIRTSHRQDFTRSAGASAALLEVAELQAMASQLQASHYDWNNPLSAQAFESWRNAQAHKTDEVVETPSEYRIRTVSQDGTLEAAAITFDAAYTPVEERLDFRDGEWVELNEIAETSTESAGGPGALPAEVPVRAAEPPSRPAAFAPGSSASISDELQVLSALNAIGADLGEQVEVALADGKVKVTGGEDIPPSRQDAIRSSIANLPHVQLEFAPKQPVAIPPAAVASRGNAVSTPASPFESRLEKQLGGHAEYDRFSTQVLDLDMAAADQMYALRRLAQKFPPEVEAQLNSQDLNLLHELSRKHTAALSGNVSKMEQLLIPALTSLGGTAASVPPANGRAGWQAASEDVRASTLRSERLISQLFGMTSDKASGSALPTDLISALNDLQANLSDCQKLLK